MFEQLEPIKVEEITTEIATKRIENKKLLAEPIEGDKRVEWQITPKQLQAWQKEDSFCINILKRIENIKTKKQEYGEPYFLREGLLHKYITDGKQKFESRVVPTSCSRILLRLAHDDMGHNGSARTYMLLRHNYYWKGMKPQVYRRVKSCEKCQQCNAHIVKYTQG